MKIFLSNFNNLFFSILSIFYIKKIFYILNFLILSIEQYSIWKKISHKKKVTYNQRRKISDMHTKYSKMSSICHLTIVVFAFSLYTHAYIYYIQIYILYIYYIQIECDIMLYYLHFTSSNANYKLVIFNK